MRDVEAALAALLAHRAGRIEPRRGHRDSTLRGARRRRVLNAVVAVVASIAVVTGGAVGVHALGETSSPRPAAPDAITESSGPYGFTSRPGEYPFVAEGEFRNADWQLRVAGVSPDRDPRVRITFQMQGPVRGLMTTSTRVPRVDPIFVRYEDSAWLFDGDVAMVFGAVVPETETVDVWVNFVSQSDRTYDAHLFEGYDAKTGLRADYFVAFVPAHSIGLVIARDEDGDEVGAAAIPQR